MTELIKPKLFNPQGSDSTSSQILIGGNVTGIINLNNSRLAWPKAMYRTMTGNTWFPEKVNMNEDKLSIKQLTSHEDEAVKDTLSFLIFMDSAQVHNLPNIAQFVTDPMIKLCLSIQTYQEAIHSQSYQYMMDALYASSVRDDIYNRWRTDPVLKKQIECISNDFQKFIDVQTVETFNEVLVTNFILEGLYFYSGFNLFDHLASRDRIVQSGKMIDYIRTDENTHTALFTHMIKEQFTTTAQKDLIYEKMGISVDRAIEWAHEKYGNKILGINHRSSENHIKSLANNRLNAVGLTPLYEGIEDPYKYLLDKKRENFFETTVTEYSTAESMDGWDDL
jgi:ribonucleoside-diphosphate reductase beta chain